MSGTWWPERLTISDDAGTAQFEVCNSPGFATMLSLRVAGGEEVATIRRRRGGRFQVMVRGKDAGLIRRRGADRYEIQCAPWPLAAAGSVRDGRYLLTRNGLAQATVLRQVADDVPQTRISVDTGDGDAVALLAAVLAIEAVRYEHAAAISNPRALLDLPPELLKFGLGMLNPFNR